jgi:hypothetical protein
MRDTKDEALKLALEEFSVIAIADNIDWIRHQAEQQATAIKQALAAPVQEPVAWMHTMIEDVVVGHRPADLNVHPDRWMPLYKDPTPCQTCEALARTVMMDQTAHDTTPPAPPAAQRQWVGLTDEERDAIFELHHTRLGGWDHGGDEVIYDKHFEDAVAAIEAKLKEKNTAAQPAPEQYTALEQALTRLQKRYAELEAKAAAQPAPVPLTDEEIDAIRFSIPTKAVTQRDFELARAIESAHGITQKGQP